MRELRKLEKSQEFLGIALLADEFGLPRSIYFIEDEDLGVSEVIGVEVRHPEQPTFKEVKGAFYIARFREEESCMH